MNMRRRGFLKGTLALSVIGVAAGAGLLTPRRVWAAWNTPAFGAKSMEAALKALEGSDAMETSHVVPHQDGQDLRGGGGGEGQRQAVQRQERGESDDRRLRRLSRGRATIAIAREEEPTMLTNTIRARAQAESGVTVVKMLIRHPMETGLVKNKATGKIIPAHFIQALDCDHNGKRVLTAHWSTAVSKNPYLSFKFAGGAPGDSLKISWVDN